MPALLSRFEDLIAQRYGLSPGWRTKEAVAHPETGHIWMPTQIKALNEEERTFEGLASTWELDLGDDVIHRGAFKRTLDHWRKSGRVMPLLDGHDYQSATAVIGKMLDAAEKKEGLWTKWQLIKGSQRADEILIRLREKVLDGLSIGYRAIKWEMEESDEARWGLIRHLKEVELREVSVVLWPMNEGSRVDLGTVKTLFAKLDARQREELRALLADSSAPPASDTGAPGRTTPEPEPAPAAAPKAADDEDEEPDYGALDRLRLARLSTRRSA